MYYARKQFWWIIIKHKIFYIIAGLGIPECFHGCVGVCDVNHEYEYLSCSELLAFL